MKTQAFILLGIFILVTSCNKQTGDNSKTSIEKNTINYTGPIIDMHIHAYQNESPLFGREMPNTLTGKKYMGSQSMQKHKEETFAKFKQHNIVKAMVSGGEDWYKTDSATVIIGQNHRNSISFLRQKYAEGKFHVLGEVAPNYDGILPTDERLEKYFDLADELSIPVAYHLYPGGPPGGAYFAFPKTRAYQGKPLQLEEILFSRPNMKFYIMHAGWPFLEDMKALMYAHPQVYVDIGVINWGIPKIEFHNFLKGLVDSGFGKRIMFGSDQMEWVKTIDEGIEAVNSAEFLTMQQKEDIFYNNAARFLSLTDEEIKRHKGQ